MRTEARNLMPGLTSELTITPKHLGIINARLLQGGVVLDGSKSRDPSQSTASNLSAGLLLGKITASGKYAPSIIGVTSEALDDTETALTVPAAVATELVRRIGATGTFKLTGPETAGGTTRTVTITYSGIDTATGVITLTAAGVNEVQRIDFGAAATGGTLKLGFTVGGALLWTDAISWNTTDATFLAAINSAIDGLLGASKCVATAIAATDTDLGFVLTFSGTGYQYAGQELVAVDAAALTSVTTVTVTRSTTGVDGDFISGSLIRPTDGSETPKLVFLGQDGYAMSCVNPEGTSIDLSIGQAVIGCDYIDVSQIPNWPSDTSLKAWLKAQLRANGPVWGFSDDY